MEVSNEIKEDIRKTQTDLKNAIRVHQVWVARLQDDENNIHLKTKVKEAEKDIIAIGQTQKLVVDRLRRELELYQQRLKARNKQINIENDTRYVAQQIRDHQIQYRGRNRTLLKPSVLNEIHVKTENNENVKLAISDSENELKSLNEKENSNHSESDEKEKFRNYIPSVHESRNNFANALNKFKEQFIEKKLRESEWLEQRSDSDSSHGAAPSPSPSPPPMPEPGEPVSQEIFLRFIGLITPTQKELLEKKRIERRKRSTTSTNRNDFLYGNYEMMPKRKKLNQFPYLQTHNDPPQTRSAKLRKQQVTNTPEKSSNNRSSREGSPSGSSTENKGIWNNNKPSWAASLPAGLSVEPVYSANKKICHGCGRSDVPSLLVWCESCAVWQHTGCGAEGRCSGCRAALPDPASLPDPHHPHHPRLPHDADAQLYRGEGSNNTLLTALRDILRNDLAGRVLPHSAARSRVAAGPLSDTDKRLYRDKLSERKRLQEKNIELCVELRKLEARAATLKENLDEHNAEKRQLLADQIRTQRNLQKLLDFISQFKETSISLRSTSLSESGSEISKSNEE